MKTQIAYSDHLNQGKYVALQEQAQRLGVIRSDVWQRFGSINSVKCDDRRIRNAGVQEKRPFNVLANPWKQTLSDAMGDIKASDVSQRRGSTLILVNAAYTSPMDSRNGTLSGKRCGDSFYCEDGVVLQADHNAAGNVKARLHDSEISQWMPYQQVKSILLARTDCHRLKLLNPDSSCKPSSLSTESESTDTYVCIRF